MPDESAPPLVHLRRVAGVDGVHRAAAGVAVAVAEDVAAVVVEGKGVEFRRVGGVEGELDHVGVAAARADVGRAVEERAVKAEHGVSALEEILPSDAEVEEPVEEAHALEPEAVEYHFVGEVVGAVLPLHAVFDEVLAEFVREAPVEGELLVVELAPHARADAQVVEVLLVVAGHHGPRRAGQPRHVVHDLFADAHVGSGVGNERGVVGLLEDGYVICSCQCGAC